MLRRVSTRPGGHERMPKETRTAPAWLRPPATRIHIASPAEFGDESDGAVRRTAPAQKTGDRPGLIPSGAISSASSLSGQRQRRATAPTGWAREKPPVIRLRLMTGYLLRFAGDGRFRRDHGGGTRCRGPAGSSALPAENPVDGHAHATFLSHQATDDHDERGHGPEVTADP